MKFIILDRDGVINHESRQYIKNPNEWIPINESLEAISKLSQAGYKIAVATNQSGVGRKYFTEEKLHEIHSKMLAEVQKHGGALDLICYCPHHPDDRCECRKPRLGMIRQMEDFFKVKISEINPHFVGDSPCDMQLAVAAGCIPVLVTGPGSDGEETLNLLDDELKSQVKTVKNLAEFVTELLDE